MSSYKWKDIVKQAEKCKQNVETTYKLGMNSKWSYYFAKAILNPNTPIKKISYSETTNPIGNYVSNQIYKEDYLNMCRKVVKFVELNKKMPNYVRWNAEKKLLPRLATYMMARILVYFYKNGAYPKYANVNSKSLVKPSEPSNEVYDYWVKRFGFKPSSLDEILEYVAEHFSYEYYYDDRKSNREVIDDQAGNCTDLLQMLVNMVIELGYDYEVLHVLCSGGDGHVRGRFRHPKNTDGEWVYRDIACTASNGSVTCNWCTSGYTLLAVNPSWFNENLHR